MTFDDGGRSIALVSVNVAEPAVIGSRRGKPVESGIGKRPVATETIAVGPLNLVGDRQADLRVHGGPEKAVYAYPVEHLPSWNAEQRPDPAFGPGTFGENLSTAGSLEDEARIGDVWRWGEALLQICQPRYPCFKLGMVTGQPGILKAMVETGRTGWYLRVLRTGEAPVAGPIELVTRDPAGVTVLHAHRARLPGATPDLLRHVLTAEALASGLRAELRAALPPDSSSPM